MSARPDTATQSPGDAAGPARAARTGRGVAVAAVTAMALLYTWSFFQRVAVPGTVFNQLQADLSISAAAVTGLAAAYLYVYAPMQMVVGYLADRFGGARVFLVGGLFLSAGAIAFPLAHELWLLYAARVLIGLGASVVYLCTAKEIDALFGGRAFGYLIGPLLVMGGLGGLLGTSPFERAVAAVGWRPALLAAGVLTALTLACVGLLVRRLPDDRHDAAAFSWRLVLDVLHNRRAIPLILAWAINFAVYFLIQGTLGKKFLQDVAGLSSPAAAWVMFAMMAVAMGLTFAAGFIATALGHRRKPMIVASLVLAVVAAGLLVPATARDWRPGWFIAAFMLMALANGQAPIVSCLLKELNAPRAMAFAIGVGNAVTYLAVAAVTNLAGVVLDRFASSAILRDGALVYPRSAYAALFAVLLAVVIAALFATFFVPETRGRSAVSFEAHA